MELTELEKALYRNWIRLLPYVGRTTIEELHLYKDNLPASERALEAALFAVAAAETH